MPLSTEAWVNASEALDVVGRLEPARSRVIPLTYDKLRYWDQCGIVPAARIEQGGARLYAVPDAAMLRLALRMLASGRGLRQVSEALRYRNHEIRAAFHGASPRLVLAFTDRGVAEVRAARPGDDDTFDLRPCMAGIRRAIRQYRSEQRELWTGRKYESAAEVSSATPRYEVAIV